MKVKYELVDWEYKGDKLDPNVVYEIESVDFDRGGWLYKGLLWFDLSYWQDLEDDIPDQVLNGSLYYNADIDRYAYNPKECLPEMSEFTVVRVVT